MINTELYGVLVTFDRPKLLAQCLSAIFEQTASLRELVIVDNAPSKSSRSVIDDFISRGHAIELISSDRNLGPAGGLAAGLQAVFSKASTNDLVALFDDNDPLPGTHTLASLMALFKQRFSADPRTAGVGLGGAKVDWRRARARPVEPSEEGGPIRVDYLYGGYSPTYSVGALRRSGTHAGELFFGFDDLELGLRLAATGYTLYIHADLWKELREYINAEEPLTRPSLTLQEPTWRRYYALRNVLYLLICGGRRSTALQIALVRGFAKPLLSLPITPRLAVLNLCINVRAIKDAWTGRMGLTVQPNNDPRDH